MLLIFGASSFIGQNLYNHFSKKEKVIGTYNNHSKPGLRYFDLRKPDLKNLDADLSKVNYAIICSAIANTDECKRNKKSSYELNVIATRKIIQQLWQFNILPIWFSSEYVFNGEKGDYQESDKRNPNTIYGHHKKEIEDFLCNSRKDFLIARLSKVFGLEKGGRTFLTSIVDQLKNNEEIRCATDQIFSPTYVGDVVEVVDLAIEKHLTGLYNVASPECFSRYEIANMIKSQLKIESGKIIPSRIADFDFLDSRPLNTSLNVEKIIQATKFRFTTMRESINLLENRIK